VTGNEISVDWRLTVVKSTSRSFLVGAAALLWLGCFVPQAVAQTPAPAVPQTPAVIDGAFTSWAEWRDARRCRDLENLGWVYIKQVENHPEPGIYAL
jgi:hypothetical protein